MNARPACTAAAPLAAVEAPAASPASASPSPAADRWGRSTKSARWSALSRGAARHRLQRRRRLRRRQRGRLHRRRAGQRLHAARSCRALFIEGARRATTASTRRLLLRPALREYCAAACASLPPLLAQRARGTTCRDPADADGVARAPRSRAIPTGMFDGERSRPLPRRACFTGPGRTNDFRKLPRKLYPGRDRPRHRRVGGLRRAGHRPRADLARGAGLARRCPACSRRWRSTAATSSTARCARRCTPRWRSTHGVDLLLCVNPLVPYDATHRVPRARSRATGSSKLVEGGLPVVLAQTFRAIIHSRHGRRHGALQDRSTRTPTSCCSSRTATDADMFFTNLFSLLPAGGGCASTPTRRRARELLRRARTSWRRVLARHGITHPARPCCATSHRTPGTRPAPPPRAPNRTRPPTAARAARPHARRACSAGSRPAPRCARPAAPLRRAAAAAAAARGARRLARAMLAGSHAAGVRRAPHAIGTPDSMERKPPRRTRERILETVSLRAVQRLRRTERQHDGRSPTR
ncbi:MAG: hypothetical protein MZW92_48115 [Comamonadaceae bacterium]|nr:hypothetical protein [Comamonadaceae bacterium]